MKDFESMQAAEDFSRARGRALLSRLQHLFHTSRDSLLSLEDVKKILKPKSETYRGMQAVPLDLIVGSEGRYRDFNKYFLPRYEHLRMRWEKVDRARLNDVILPPIQLYEIGGVYFVRDGNHRVSVARSQGCVDIDAEVTSLSSEIPIDPSMTTGDLKKAVLAYEKKLFYEKTNFGKLSGCDDLDFSSPGSYDLIYEHILVHKYYLNEKVLDAIPFQDALVSWYYNVYRPIIEIVKDEKIRHLFPGATEGDLYLWIVQYWDLLKKKYGPSYSLSDAVAEFNTRFGRKPSGPWDYLSIFFNKIFRSKI
ncbi:MAG: transcriptional regulator [Spirochaetaceae bacterium]|jgi:hypothetical protein|nr:transcriptional regulator [Spirochaetaceae bacterium]